MGIQMNVIGERQSRSSAASIPQVPPDPDGIDIVLTRRFEHCAERFRTKARGILPIMNSAPISVGIEGVLECQGTQVSDKGCRRSDAISPSEVDT